ncbi:MAG: hypothetical protein AB1758_28990, partial [Candidatus Eremiobacterota bacterium]
RSPVKWEAGPGWELADGAWRHSGKQAEPLLSSPIPLPLDGETILSLTASGSLNVSLVVAGEQDVTVPVDGGSVSFSLLEHRGKTVRLRVTGDGEVRDLRLTEEKLGQLERVLLRDMKNESLGTVSSYVTPKPLMVPLGSPRLSLTETHRVSSGAAVRLELHDGADWRVLDKFRGHQLSAGRHVYDLSQWKGRPIYLRYCLDQPRYESCQITPHSLALVEGRPSLDALALEMIGRQPIGEATASECLRLAFDPDASESTRANTLLALHELGQGGAHLDRAVEALPILRDHLGQPDLVDRARALAVLLEAGERDLAGAYSALQAERHPGESLEAMARLLAGRNREDFVRMRQVVRAEGSEAAPAQLADFLGAVQGSPHVETIWRLVSEPVRSETLPERLDGFRSLLVAFGGKTESAEKVYRAVVASLDPNEQLPRAMRAAAELTAALRSDEVRVLALLERLHAFQREGPLEGRSLMPMARFLVGEAILSDADLEAALLRMPDELSRQLGIEERERHILVGGVRVNRRG